MSQESPEDIHKPAENGSNNTYQSATVILQTVGTNIFRT
jgi:hypothetical protein